MKQRDDFLSRKLADERPHCLWNTIGPVQYLSLALWALIFYLAKRGVAQAESWGIAPKGA